MSILGKIHDLAGVVGSVAAHPLAEMLHYTGATQGQRDANTQMDINKAAGFNPGIAPSPYQRDASQNAFTVSNINSSIGGMRVPGGMDMGWAAPQNSVQSPFGYGINPDQPTLDNINQATGFDLPIYLRRR